MHRSISRPGFARIVALLAGGGVAAAAAPASAAFKTHHVALHVDRNDPAVVNLALNNIANISQLYSSKAETC
jgi:hypothetical protein